MLEITSFICGAAVMVMEMAGSRLLAPYLGTSIVVWTALIGVILASLSLGYWLGGKAGDKNPSAGKLARIIAAAALCVFLASLVQRPVLSALSASGMPLELGAILAAVMLFAAPSILLGMVSPYIIQVKLLSIKGGGQTGSIMGRFFALSTIGSIVGTFLGGYVLIAWLGTRTILYVVAGTLGLAAALTAPRRARVPGLALALAAGGMIVQGLLSGSAGAMPLAVDTRYNHLLISEGYLNSPARVRFLQTDPRSAQSAMKIETPADLVFEYTKHYAIAWHIFPEAKKFLMLGGGGYSVPKHLLHIKPEARVDVVEIDPGITQAARQHFALPDDERLRVFDEDARVFLNRRATAEPVEQYEIIMGDTFSSSYNIPFHLATVECAQRIHSLLKNDGVFACNIISGVSGDKGRVFRAIHASFSQVFPQVHVFPITQPKNGDEVQNIMLIALKTPRPIPLAWGAEMQGMLGKEWLATITADTPALTDDFGPIERYAMPLIR